jgi:hypothetical protein
MFKWEGTKDSGTDLFFSVFKEDWILNDSEDVARNFAVSESDCLCTFEFSSLFFSHVLSDRYWEQMFMSIWVSDSFHLDDF